MPTFVPPTRRPKQVLRRAAVEYVDGEAVAGTTTPGVVAMSVQAPSLSDFQARSSSEPGGDRSEEMAVAYTAVGDALAPSGRDERPGDLVWHKGAWWLCVGASDYDTLIGTPVAHVRHMLVRLNPGEDEAPPPPPAEAVPAAP